VQGKAYRLYFGENRWKNAYGDEREALTFDTPLWPDLDGPRRGRRGLSPGVRR